MPKFTLKGKSKSGVASYTTPNLRGSIRISKSLLKTDAPAEFEKLEDLPWADPSAGLAAMTPEKQAVIKAKAEKAIVRAQRAQERANKLAAKAGLTTAPAAEPVDIAPEAEPVATEM